MTRETDWRGEQRRRPERTEDEESEKGKGREEGKEDERRRYPASGTNKGGETK